MSNAERPRRGIPEGLWVKCPSCKATVFKKDVERNLNVCPECGHHFYASARQRIEQLLDENTFEEWDAELRPTDALGFVDRAGGLSLAVAIRTAILEGEALRYFAGGGIVEASQPERELRETELKAQVLRDAGDLLHPDQPAGPNENLGTGSFLR